MLTGSMNLFVKSAPRHVVLQISQPFSCFGHTNALVKTFGTLCALSRTISAPTTVPGLKSTFLKSLQTHYNFSNFFSNLSHNIFSTSIFAQAHSPNNAKRYEARCYPGSQKCSILSGSTPIAVTLLLQFCPCF